MMSWPRLLVTVSFAAMLGGCANAPLPPPDRFHRLDAPAINHQPQKLPLLSIYPYEVQGIYAERPLIYRNGDAQRVLRQYRYEFWAEPVEQSLQDALVRDLRKVAGDEWVFTRSARVSAEIILRPRLLRLEHVVGEQEQERAELSLRFSAFEDSRAPLFVLDVERSQTLDGKGPDAFVAAVAQMATEAHAELVQRLIEEK